MHSRKAIAPLRKAEFEKKIADGVNQKLTVGNGLYLHVRDGSSLWVIQYRDGESHRARSLGTYPEVSLNAARQKREAFAVERREKRIPRRGLAVINSAAPAREPVKADEDEIKPKRFADVIEEFLTINIPQWKPDSTEARKYRLLKTGALGKMWTDEIKPAHVKTELQSRWGHALASAEKYRMRTLKVMSYAMADHFRTPGQNPADKEIMKHLIAAAPKSKPHKPMPSAAVPAFMAELVADGSPEARALAFLILTASRTGNVIEADWSEIKGNVWTIPAAQMKEKENGDHRMPLSPAALALLGKPRKSGRIFGDLPHDALNDKLNELRPDDGFTVHGLRTTFKGDWALKAGYPLEKREMALHHAVSEASVAAYKLPHSELYTVIIDMMQAWSDFATAR
jgi:integrase